MFAAPVPTQQASLVIGSDLLTANLLVLCHSLIANEVGENGTVMKGICVSWIVFSAACAARVTTEAAVFKSRT